MVKRKKLSDILSNWALPIFTRQRGDFINSYLELNLWVNDEIRQSANTNQLLFKPAETLQELSEIMDLSPGDLVLTGTTGGVALNLSAEVMDKVSSLEVSGQKKLEVLLETQLTSDKYLKDGDVMRLTIKSSDETIDLGEQISKVVPSQVTVS